MLSRDPKGSACKSGGNATVRLFAHAGIPTHRSGWALAAVLAAAVCAASDLDEFKVKREGPFEFSQKPVVTRTGDRVTITFETKSFCDVTVAIEDAAENVPGTLTSGYRVHFPRIVRHLASGLLGPNAPAPFEKNAKRQSIVWDGKDDQGAYVEDFDRVIVRVSLGLKARFERQYLWSPHRRISAQGGTFCTHGACVPLSAQPEGVYVFDGKLFDHLRLFDHDGNYVRTIYPFPADKVTSLVGVRTHVFPQSGRTLPFKGGNYQSTLLTSGTTAHGDYLTQRDGIGATTMAVRNGRIALAGRYLNRLATDGSTGGLPLEGPETHVGNRMPRSAAFSPDGKTLYLTGFTSEHGNPNWYLSWAHGVARIDFANGEKMETFAGRLGGGREDGGSEPGQFKAPTSVDCDAQGRVYVTDHFNDRVQIFNPAGQHLKSIPVTRPSEVCIDQRTGEIYVFSWYVDSRQFRPRWPKGHPTPKLTRFGPFDDPKMLGKYPLPIPGNHQNMGRYGGDSVQGRQFRAEVDSWSGDGTPTIWMLRWDNSGGGRRGSTEEGSVRLYRIDPDRDELVLVQDFARTAARHLPDLAWPAYGKNRPYVRPTTGEVYNLVTRMGVGSNPPIICDPETGRSRAVAFPFDPGDMAFDINGHAYLRTHREVVRYDILPGDHWREMPFDYGVERSLGNGVRGAIPIHTTSIGHAGGVSVSPKGHVVAAFIFGAGEGGGGPFAAARWAPVLFPGRGGNNMVVRVWDKHGKVFYADAVRGIGYLHGLFMDRDDNLYLMSETKRPGYFDTMIGTLVKVRPDSRVLAASAKIALRQAPDRPHDTTLGAIGKAWWEEADWFYSGVGFCGKNNSTCHCPSFRPAIDYFARTFVPETQHYTVAVVDSAGNVILRIGQYGNVDDGIPLKPSVPEIPMPNRRPLGGDEVGLFYPAYLAAHSDRRLYIYDPGNARLVGVKLDYHATKRVALKDVKDTGG